MIYLAAVAIVNTAFAAYLVHENRKLTYAAIARHSGEIANIERATRAKPKPPTETSGETTYHTWRNADEGVGP